MEFDALWGELVDGLYIYVENYFLARHPAPGSSVQPSYPVDYEIEDIDKIFADRSIENYWIHRIARCRNINDLPEHLQKLVIQFLPRFFAEHPEYASAQSLKLDK